MNTHLNCKDRHLPHFLEKGEITSPLTVIKNHFSASHLNEWRHTLWHWINAVMVDDITCVKMKRKSTSASGALYDIKLIEKLIEACSLIVANQFSTLKGKAKRKHRLKMIRGREQPKLIEIKDILHTILFLKDEEISEPRLVLVSFFRYYSLDEWRYLLDEWLYYGLSRNGNAGEYWHDNTFYCYAQLVRLTEACFLINELENKKS